MPPRQSPQPKLTHFLALTSTRLQQSAFPGTFAEFHTSATSPENGIPAAAIRPLGTMHLTLGVMALGAGAHEVDRAVQALSEGVALAREKAGMGDGAGGLRVRLVGLRTFESRSGGRGVGGAGLERCRVLWVEPQDSVVAAAVTSAAAGSDSATAAGDTASKEANTAAATSALHSFSTALRNHFLSKDLIYLSPRERAPTIPATASDATSEQPPEPSSLTLHLTVLNQVYTRERNSQRRGGGGHRRGGKHRTKDSEGYDCRSLVEQFKDTVWAEDVLFDRVEVMKMGEVRDSVGGIGDDGEERLAEAHYVSVAYVDL
ncbi:hypothetical protein BDZ91DRAFT_847682 [Kalaharituber pfeilii]|nr:hypothetical protein BDZ91DRAFT_847682 [Kalaharituber pfeilii]